MFNYVLSFYSDVFVLGPWNKGPVAFDQSILNGTNRAKVWEKMKQIQLNFKRIYIIRVSVLHLSKREHQNIKLIFSKYFCGGKVPE